MSPPLLILPTSTNTALLSWPVSCGGTELLYNDWLNWGNFTLEQNSDLNPTTWIASPGIPIALNGTNQMIISPSQNRQFYRLKSPD